MLQTSCSIILLTFFTIIVSASGDDSFCWRDTYTRNIGKVPESCAPNQVRIGLFCYDNCPAGFARFGFDCHSVCPQGFRDDGLFCRLTEYGRGAGYPWRFGDPLNDSKQWQRCLHDHPQGCEKWGLIVYPKCAPGYSPFGCCICRPNPPDCPSHGLNPGIDLSCAKRIQIGNPQIGTCSPGFELDAGLCYPQCNPGYHGVGFVCWSQPPPTWVECGMGAATTPKTCASMICGQITSVGQLCINIASGFSTSSVQELKTPADPDKLAHLKQAYNSIKNNENIKKAVEAYEKANNFKKGYISIDTAMQATTVEDMVRLAAMIAAFTDPTGVANVIVAYSYPKCSKLKELNENYYKGSGNLKVVLNESDNERSSDLEILNKNDLNGNYYAGSSNLEVLNGNDNARGSDLEILNENDLNGNYYAVGSSNLEVLNGNYYAGGSNLEVLTENDVKISVNLEVLNGNHHAESGNLGVLNENYKADDSNLDLMNKNYHAGRSNLEVLNENDDQRSSDLEVLNGNHHPESAGNLEVLNENYNAGISILELIGGKNRAENGRGKVSGRRNKEEESGNEKGEEKWNEEGKEVGTSSGKLRVFPVFFEYKVESFPVLLTSRRLRWIGMFM
ncbi:uncharacterized protein LOC111054203 [Nilaparvata lugens]|uniref:uncharacterized protein LOC111054203 n=1 Tax=Nilaparvata lugens TaxID=108931 RepID=UPI00193E0A9B|nr:uncharacterized protein LOC111054203 [Nilaparvata lugens]